MAIDWQPLAEMIRGADRFLITSHVRGDCDAIGSEVALAMILESLGKQTLIVNGDEVPEHIAFMDPERRVRVAGMTAPLGSAARVRGVHHRRHERVVAAWRRRPRWCELSRASGW